MVRPIDPYSLFERTSHLPEDQRGEGFGKFGEVNLKSCLEVARRADVKDLSSVKILKSEGDNPAYQIDAGKKGWFNFTNRKLTRVDNLELFVIRHADAASINKLSAPELEQLAKIADGVRKSPRHLFSKIWGSERVAHANQVLNLCHDASNKILADKKYYDALVQHPNLFESRGGQLRLTESGKKYLKSQVGKQDIIEGLPARTGVPDSRQVAEQRRLIVEYLRSTL